jgi:hypothetical protein
VNPASWSVLGPTSSHLLSQAPPEENGSLRVDWEDFSLMLPCEEGFLTNFAGAFAGHKGQPRLLENREWRVTP